MNISSFNHRKITQIVCDNKNQFNELKNHLLNGGLIMGPYTELIDDCVIAVFDKMIFTYTSELKDADITIHFDTIDF